LLLSSDMNRCSSAVALRVTGYSGDFRGVKAGERRSMVQFMAEDALKIRNGPGERIFERHLRLPL